MPQSPNFGVPLNSTETFSTLLNFYPHVKVLNVGCGNSILPEEMYDTDGYR